MIGTGRVAWRRPDSLICLADERGVVQRLTRLIAPVITAHRFVESLRERLRQPVRERLEKDRVVIVVARLKRGNAGVNAMAGRHSERANPVANPRRCRRDKIGQRHVRPTIALGHLLTDAVDGSHRSAAAFRLGGPDRDIVADGTGREESDHRPRGEPLLRHDAGQHRLRVVPEASGGFADDRILQDVRIVAGQLPGLEERRPVNARHEVFQRPAVEYRYARPVRHRRHGRGPVDLHPVSARIRQRHQSRGLAGRGAMDANCVIFGAHAGHECVPPVVAQQCTGHADRATGVLHMHHRPRILRLDLHRRVGPAGGCTTDQERNGESLALHLTSQKRHLLQRWCYQATKPDDVHIFTPCGLQNPGTRHHHPEIDHVVVVALQHHADDVLADVVHVALHGRQQDLSLLLLILGRHQQLLGLDIRNQMRHGALHDARTLHHLRQEHLAGTEQIADDVHAVHQRPFDHVDRPRDCLACLFGVFNDEIGDAMHQGVRQTLAHRQFAPRQ